MTARRWFAIQGWKPFAFQEEAWSAFRAGVSGLIHAPTGMGKTYAVWMGLIEDAATNVKPDDQRPPKPHGRRAAGLARKSSDPLTAIWLTPLRALAADTASALERPVRDLLLPWSIETRTGDTSSTVRTRQRERLPTCLVTTPESLTLLLTRSDAGELFTDLKLIVVDEWHEFFASKRGVQVELALARLRRWRPQLQTWGLSATIGNLEEALAALVPHQSRSVLIPSLQPEIPTKPTLIRGLVPKRIDVDALIPDVIERLPWVGHLGARQIPAVVEELAAASSCLVFANTRSFAEFWYRSILTRRPDWEGKIGLHHGSIDQKQRRRIEDGVRDGTLRAVVCTSSLDLGVDFAPVERVLQIGSPKGVARLIQRAGRSGHRPGAISRATCVPTHAFELVEIAALRRAVADGWIERRTPPTKPLDVLLQHLGTCALGGGFDETLLDELHGTRAYAFLMEDEWRWAVDFLSSGGRSLHAYPEHRRIEMIDGRYQMPNNAVARRHRMAIGTIDADASVQVQFLRGGALGSVEESFVARLNPGDAFLFAGRMLELVRLHDMTAWVRKTKKSSGAVPRWLGGRLPLSSELAAAVRDRIDEAKRGIYVGEEMAAVEPVLVRQAEWSQLPGKHELLVERFRSRDGVHLFVYPFESRPVHEGLAALLALRLSRRRPITFTIAANDYGFELLSPDPPPIDPDRFNRDFDRTRMADDLGEALNSGELTRRQFREIARIAGLVFPGFPGMKTSARHLQASSGLYFDVFRNYDPDNLLLKQAEQEVLQRQLEGDRLAAALDRLRDASVLFVDLAKPSPMAFPLLVDGLRDKLSSEKLADRIRKMQLQYEEATPSLVVRR
jgi:ATP-dependent helicase Lhr and Lhr-like helicase